MPRASGRAASLVALAAYAMSAPALTQDLGIVQSPALQGTPANNVDLAPNAARQGEQGFRMVPSLALQGTLTNNVDLATNAERQGDFVTQVTPGLTFAGRGARTRLDGFVSLPVALYARTGSENNNIFPSANVTGDVALIDNFFHVQGQVAVSQQFFSPFGAQPNDFSNATANRYRTSTYSVSPYFSGLLADGGSYELRNNNVWTVLTDAPVNANDSFYTQVLGNLRNDQRAVGYRVHYEYNDTQFSDDTGTRTSLVRAGPVWNVDPQVRLLASVGYETNDYQLTSSNGAIYGGGIEWSPTERTKVVGLYEHRFFGASYLASLTHRRPLSEWALSATRNVTTYPQQLYTLPVGIDVSSFLNNLLLSSIPDPVARQNAVNQLMNDRGLPPTLSTPVNIYSQQNILQEAQTATVTLLGARNTILVQIYNVRSEPITATGAVIPTVPGLANNNNTQLGVNVAWNTRLGPRLNLATSVNAYRTVSNDPSISDVSTRQGVAQVTLSTPIGARTSAFVGARYQMLRSNVVSEYEEAAALIGIVYTYQ